MAIGYLQIQARIAQNAVPLEGARVWVLDGEGNALYHLVTDESGETQTVSLEAPDRSFSQSPDYLGKPYAEYSVMVEAEGFEPVSVERIPVRRCRSGNGLRPWRRWTSERLPRTFRAGRSRRETPQSRAFCARW